MVVVSGFVEVSVVVSLVEVGSSVVVVVSAVVVGADVVVVVVVVRADVVVVVVVGADVVVVFVVGADVVVDDVGVVVGGSIVDDAVVVRLVEESSARMFN